MTLSNSEDDATRNAVLSLQADKAKCQVDVQECLEQSASQSGPDSLQDGPAFGQWIRIPGGKVVALHIGL